MVFDELCHDIITALMCVVCVCCVLMYWCMVCWCVLFCVVLLRCVVLCNGVLVYAWCMVVSCGLCAMVFGVGCMFTYFVFVLYGVYYVVMLCRIV